MAFSLVNSLDCEFESDAEDESSMDTTDLDDKTLELLGCFTPLGYRILSSITGLEENILKGYVRASLLNPINSSFDNITTYFNNSQCHSFKMQLNRIIKVSRYDDYDVGYEKKNLKLLWHGTTKDSLGSILIHGFCRPGHKDNKQMFGSGVYFADRVSKSAQYCDGTEIGKTGYLVLCGVNLGNIFTSTAPLQNYEEPPAKYDSVMGIGQYVPCANETSYYQNYAMPSGRTTFNFANYTKTPLKYNEYIVYDVCRISMKFIIEFEIV